MEVKDLFKQEASFFNQELTTKPAVIDFLATKLLEAKIISKKSDFIRAIETRENKISTGMGDGVAIPHALNPSVQYSTIAFLSLKTPIEWGSFDGQPVDLIFMIATNGKDGDEHLTALAGLSSYLMKADALAAFRKVKNYSELMKVFGQFKPNAQKPHDEQQSTTSDGYDVVGITACPTGIAHNKHYQSRGCHWKGDDGIDEIRAYKLLKLARWIS